MSWTQNSFLRHLFQCLLPSVPTHSFSFRAKGSVNTELCERHEPGPVPCVFCVSLPDTVSPVASLRSRNGLSCCVPIYLLSSAGRIFVQHKTGLMRQPPPDSLFNIHVWHYPDLFFSITMHWINNIPLYILMFNIVYMNRETFVRTKSKSTKVLTQCIHDIHPYSNHFCL